MAIYKRDIASINLETGTIHRTFLNHSIGYKDQKADHFGIRVFRDGEPVDLTGVSVQGIFMPPQGDPIAITSGNIVSGNEAEVVLPQACYNYDGQFTLSIKLVDATNAVTGTMRIVDGMVDNTHASGTVAPTDAVPTYQEILAVYAQLLEDVTDYESVVATQDEKIDDLKSALCGSNGFILIEGWLTGAYKTSDGEAIDPGNPATGVDGYECVYAECVEGDIFTIDIYNSATSSYRPWAFFDSSKELIQKASDNTGRYSNVEVTAPANAAYFTVNAKSDRLPHIVYKGRVSDTRITELNTETKSTFQSKDESLRSGLKEEAGINLYTFEAAYYLTGNDASTNGELRKSSTFAGVKIPCSQGDVFNAHVYGGSGSQRAFALYDSNNALINRSSANYELNGSISITGDYANAAYIIFNNKLSSMSTGYYAYKGEKLNVPKIKEDVSKINTEVNTLIGIEEITILDRQFGCGYLTTGSSIDINSPTSNSGLISCYTECTKGDIFVYSGRGSASYTNWVFLESDGTIISRSTAGWYRNEVISAPMNSAYVVFNFLAEYENRIQYAIKGLPRSMTSEKRPWEGLYVSLIGDSMSAFQGYIPSENGKYYPNPNSNVSKVNQMWWHQLIYALGGTPLIIDAWSGSCVTKGIRENYTEISNASRCQRLHAYVQTTDTDPDGILVTADNVGTMRTSPFLTPYTLTVGDYVKTVNPDIVLVAGGTNDYTYMTNASQFGTYDGHTSLANPYGDEAAVTTFREAYATLLCRIQNTYPYALTICCQSWFCVRPYLAKYNVNKNTDTQLTQKDFMDAIAYIADLRACPVVDLVRNGFNRYNYYDLFAEDSSYTPTHATILGHKIIAENAIESMRNLCSGYVKWLRERKEET